MWEILMWWEGGNVRISGTCRIRLGLRRALVLPVGEDAKYRHGMELVSGSALGYDNGVVPQC